MERFAQVASVPVINGLTDRSHPCQILADLQTFEEALGGPSPGMTFAWVGDGNNVCASLIHAAGRFGFNLRHRLPARLPPRPDGPRPGGRGRRASPSATIPGRRSRARTRCSPTPGSRWATPTTTSGSHAFEPFQVDEALMAAAPEDAVFLHCLPAHRGEEVTDAVIDGPRSRVWDEAENRIHAQKAVLAWCFGLI